VKSGSPARRSPSDRRVRLRTIALLILLLGNTTCLAVSSPRRGLEEGQVAPKLSAPGQYRGYTSPKFDDVETTSFYLPMRDGVRIAVDLHLPAGRSEGERLPTILYQTRYVRAFDYRWPFSLMRTPTELTRWIRLFVSHGYAWVTVDARGSGASFGTRKYELSPDEIQDGAEIADWIVRQPWSDGGIGSFGTSYTGSSAELLLANGHPAVKAVAPRFSMADAYADLAFPGGIHQTWFTQKWAHGNEAIDTNTITGKFGLKVRMMVKGIKRVDEDEDGALLDEAIRQHAQNGDVHREALGITFRDDVSPSGAAAIDALSPFTYLDEIEASGAAIYYYSGWWDGAYPHAAIKKYMTLHNPKKLTLGPWDHGGRQEISPWRRRDAPAFDHDLEMLRFFDHHLKGIQNGIMEEAPVHYFTMGEEQWKSAASWPPPNAYIRRLYLSEGHRLRDSRPAGEPGPDAWVVDYSSGTGNLSRWNSLTARPRGWLGGERHFEYPNRKEEDRKLPCYTSAPLTEDTEVTGHPLIRLFVTSTAEDGNFFVYLEDVDASGGVTYVTEGELRALHRRLSDERPPYRLLVPYRSFERKDARPLVPGEMAELVFDLLPTSYLFRKGHSIRLAIAGADKDHFALLAADEPPTLTFHRSEAHPSAIELPIVPR